MNQLPEWFKRASVVTIFLLELGTPLLIFGRRRTRWIACAGVVALQGMIGATGNYTFFKLLTISLAVLLLDDSSWRRVLPNSLVALLTGKSGRRDAASSLGATTLGLLLLVAGTARFGSTLVPRRKPSPVDRVFRWVAPFRSINGYGLFRVMTTTRREIVIEGSDDGRSGGVGDDWRMGDASTAGALLPGTLACLYAGTLA